MKIDKDAFGQFFDGTPGKSWDDYASRLKNAAAGEVDDSVRIGSRRWCNKPIEVHAAGH